MDRIRNASGNIDFSYIDFTVHKLVKEMIDHNTEDTILNTLEYCMCNGIDFKKMSWDEVKELENKILNRQLMDVDPAWTPDKQSSNKPHYYVESYYNCRQNVNYTNIGPATKSDMKHSGDNWFNLNEGFRFDVHDSLRDAITKAGFIANKITFLDLSETESQHANEIVQELMQDETYLEQFRPKNITEILAEISQ